MNIPLIGNVAKQDINTSLIAIRNAINELNNSSNKSNADIQKQINLINEQIKEFNIKFGDIDIHLNAIDSDITDLQPVDTVASGNLHSVTSNGVYNALKPIAKTANQYVIKGNDVASIDTSNYTGYRLNKVTSSQYHLHFEPLRFTAKANPPQGYFAIADFSNALVQLYSDSRSQNFSNEVLMYIADETNGTYAIASCYIVNKVLSIRAYFPFNQSFSFIEGHSYAMIGVIDLWLA